MHGIHSSFYIMATCLENASLLGVRDFAGQAHTYSRSRPEFSARSSLALLRCPHPLLSSCPPRALIVIGGTRGRVKDSSLCCSQRRPSEDAGVCSYVLSRTSAAWRVIDDDKVSPSAAFVGNAVSYRWLSSRFHACHAMQHAACHANLSGPRML